MTKFKDFGSEDTGQKEEISFKIHGEEFFAVQSYKEKFS